MRHIGTKHQLADILTKGHFTGAQFEHLCEGCMLGPRLPIDVSRISVCGSKRNGTPLRNLAKSKVPSEISSTSVLDP